MASVTGHSGSALQSVMHQFIRNELWNGTVRAALQRNKTYKVETSEAQRIMFRNAIRKELQEIEKRYHTGISITDEEHNNSILKLQQWSLNFQHVLHNGRLNIGTCQKFLNIHLKNLWCAGVLIHMPPHAPIDAIIRDRLKLKMGSWTNMDRIEEYQSIIDQLRVIADKNSMTIAELELFVYDGNTDSLEL